MKDSNLSSRARTVCSDIHCHLLWIDDSWQITSLDYGEDVLESDTLVVVPTTVTKLLLITTNRLFFNSVKMLLFLDCLLVIEQHFKRIVALQVVQNSGSMLICETLSHKLEKQDKSCAYRQD